MGWMQWSVLAMGGMLILAGCATTTTNGMSPQSQGMVGNYSAFAAAPLPPARVTSAPVRSAPAVVSRPPTPSITPPPVRYSSTALPLTTVAPALPAAPAIPAAPSAAQTLSDAGTSFSGAWQGDMTKARQDSARCAAMSSAARTSCWQDVSAWAEKRAAHYQALSTRATGAQSQQLQSAAKFFGVTGEWASACSSITSQQCAESPLIGKMQQWKASVGIPGAAVTIPTP